MKNIIISILTILLLPVAPIVAQQNGSNLDYVAGEEYKITNQNGGFTIEWNGQPAPPEQIRSVSEEEITVLTPEGEERLVITVNEDGTFREVIDLKYQKPKTGYGRKDRRGAESRPKETPSLRRAGRVFTFENGLKIVVADQSATATYRGKSLDVTGGKGRWRVQTDEFEAGVAYGPGYGEKAYKYLKLKSDEH